MRFSIKKAATTLGLGATGALVLAQSALAQNLGPLEKIEPITPIGGGDTSLWSAIGSIVNIILIIVGVLAVLYLIYGGILYITAGGDAEKAAKGRTAITNAIIGIVIILLAIAIYNFVIRGIRYGSTNVTTER